AVDGVGGLHVCVCTHWRGYLLNIVQARAWRTRRSRTAVDPWGRRRSSRRANARPPVTRAAGIPRSRDRVHVGPARPRRNRVVRSEGRGLLSISSVAERLPYVLGCWLAAD